MMIRVNKSTWLCFDAIQKIEIAHANILGKSKTRFSVTVWTARDDYSELFDTYEEAEKFAQDIADKINSEAQHEKI